MTLEQATDKIEKVFENSVNAHKISDVEVGCFLSSGVDSSYVSSYFEGQKLLLLVLISVKNTMK